MAVYATHNACFRAETPEFSASLQDAERSAMLRAVKRSDAATELHVVKRAYALAQSGGCETVNDVCKLLKQEGYTVGHIEMHLGGR